MMNSFESDVTYFNENSKDQGDTRLKSEKFNPYEKFDLIDSALSLASQHSYTRNHCFGSFRINFGKTYKSLKKYLKRTECKVISKNIPFVWKKRRKEYIIMNMRDLRRFQRVQKETEWFSKQFGKKFKPPVDNYPKLVEKENALRDKQIRLALVKLDRQKQNRKVSELRNFRNTIMLPLPLPEISWKAPRAIKCTCPSKPDSCICKGNTLYRKKRIPRLISPYLRDHCFIRLLKKLRILNKNKFILREGTKTLVPKLIETFKIERQFYNSNDGQEILAKRGPEFCLSDCLHFYETNRKKKNPTSEITKIREMKQEIVVIEEEPVVEEVVEEEPFVPVERRRPISDRTGDDEHGWSVSTHMDLDECGDLIDGDYLHLLFGNPDDTYMKDISGICLQISSFKECRFAQTDCTCLRIDPRQKKETKESGALKLEKIFLVNTLKDEYKKINEKISKMKKDFVMSLFNVHDKYIDRATQFECSDVVMEGVCESLVDAIKRRKERIRQYNKQPRRYRSVKSTKLNLSANEICGTKPIEVTSEPVVSETGTENKISKSLERTEESTKLDVSANKVRDTKPVEVTSGPVIKEIGAENEVSKPLEEMKESTKLDDLSPKEFHAPKPTEVVPESNISKTRAEQEASKPSQEMKESTKLDLLANKINNTKTNDVITESAVREIGANNEISKPLGDPKQYTKPNLSDNEVRDTKLIEVTSKLAVRETGAENEVSKPLEETKKSTKLDLSANEVCAPKPTEVVPESNIIKTGAEQKASKPSQEMKEFTKLDLSANKIHNTKTNDVTTESAVRETGANNEASKPLEDPKQFTKPDLSDNEVRDTKLIKVTSKLAVRENGAENEISKPLEETKKSTKLDVPTNEARDTKTTEIISEPAVSKIGAENNLSKTLEETKESNKLDLSAKEIRKIKPPEVVCEPAVSKTAAENEVAKYSEIEDNGAKIIKESPLESVIFENDKTSRESILYDTLRPCKCETLTPNKLLIAENNTSNFDKGIPMESNELKFKVPVTDENSNKPLSESKTLQEGAKKTEIKEAIAAEKITIDDKLEPKLGLELKLRDQEKLDELEKEQNIDNGSKITKIESKHLEKNTDVQKCLKVNERKTIEKDNLQNTETEKPEGKIVDDKVKKLETEPQLLNAKDKTQKLDIKNESSKIPISESEEALQKGTKPELKENQDDKSNFKIPETQKADKISRNSKEKPKLDTITYIITQPEINKVNDTLTIEFNSKSAVKKTETEKREVSQPLEETAETIPTDPWMECKFETTKMRNYLTTEDNVVNFNNVTLVDSKVNNSSITIFEKNTEPQLSKSNKTLKEGTETEIREIQDINHNNQISETRKVEISGQTKLDGVKKEENFDDGSKNANLKPEHPERKTVKQNSVRITQRKIIETNQVKKTEAEKNIVARVGYKLKKDEPEPHQVNINFVKATIQHVYKNNENIKAPLTKTYKSLNKGNKLEIKDRQDIKNISKIPKIQRTEKTVIINQPEIKDMEDNKRQTKIINTQRAEITSINKKRFENNHLKKTKAQNKESLENSSSKSRNKPSRQKKEVSFKEHPPRKNTPYTVVPTVTQYLLCDSGRPKVTELKKGMNWRYFLRGFGGKKCLISSEEIELGKMSTNGNRTNKDVNKYTTGQNSLANNREAESKRSVFDVCLRDLYKDPINIKDSPGHENVQGKSLQRDLINLQETHKNNVRKSSGLMNCSKKVLNIFKTIKSAESSDNRENLVFRDDIKKSKESHIEKSSHSINVRRMLLRKGKASRISMKNFSDDNFDDSKQSYQRADTKQPQHFNVIRFFPQTDENKHAEKYISEKTEAGVSGNNSDPCKSKSEKRKEAKQKVCRYRFYY